MADIKELIEKKKKAEPPTAEVEYEGVKFRLRGLRSAAELAELFSQARMAPLSIPYHLPDGREVKVPRDVWLAVKWVKACLVEPELTEADLVELSEVSGLFIFQLLDTAVQLCGLGEMEKMEDFFAPLKGGSGGQ